MSRLIGITGGIGSGKTTVSNFIKEVGYPVYNSDVEAINLVNQDVKLKIRIIDLLGKKSYDINGNYDRKYVGSRVFKDKKLLNSLNSIIHPAVAQDFKQWSRHQKTTLIFKETALLFELKLNLECFKSILVTADRDVRINRVMSRDHKSQEEVEKIIDKQMDESEKKKLADYVIENNNDIDTLLNQTKLTIGLIKNSIG